MFIKKAKECFNFIKQEYQTSANLFQNKSIIMFTFFSGKLADVCLQILSSKTVTARSKKCKQLFEYQHLLLLRDT
jgi:hypothetical protein